MDRIALLEAALRPFARYGRQMAAQWGQHDDSAFYGVKRPGAHQLTYGDFRRAAAILPEERMSRNLVQYPITQAEVVHVLRVRANEIRDRGIGDLTPYILDFCAKLVEDMSSETWTEVSRDLNP